VGEGVGVALGVTLGVCVAVGVPLAVAVGVWLAATVAVVVWLASTVADGVAVVVETADAVGVAEPVAVAVGVAVLVAVAVAGGVAVRVALGVALLVLEGGGAGVRDADKAVAGPTVTVSLARVVRLSRGSRSQKSLEDGRESGWASTNAPEPAPMATMAMTARPMAAARSARRRLVWFRS
jgi:hypothetical protein